MDMKVAICRHRTILHIATTILHEIDASTDTKFGHLIKQKLGQNLEFVEIID